MAVLAVGADGGVRALDTPDTSGSGSEQLIGVNQEFLLEAVNSRAGEQLLLELDGPLAPLVLRCADRPDTLSLLMPVQLPQSVGHG